MVSPFLREVWSKGGRGRRLTLFLRCARRKHEKLHSADRPFACEICTKAFTTHAHLKGKVGGTREPLRSTYLTS